MRLPPSRSIPKAINTSIPLPITANSIAGCYYFYNYCLYKSVVSQFWNLPPPPGRSLVKVEANFSLQACWYRLISIVGRSEPPEWENVQHLLVQAHARRTRNGWPMHSAIRAYIERYNQRSHVFTLSRFFAKGRINTQEGFGKLGRKWDHA